jgi:hypothetical protein
MSDEYHYQADQLEEEEVKETLESKFQNMTEAQFTVFYRHLLRRLGISRHASAELQVWHVLSVDRYVIAKVLAEVEAARK